MMKIRLEIEVDEKSIQAHNDFDTQYEGGTHLIRNENELVLRAMEALFTHLLIEGEGITIKEIKEI
jgi:hypothetical protein